MVGMQKRNKLCDLVNCATFALMCEDEKSVSHPQTSGEKLSSVRRTAAARSPLLLTFLSFDWATGNSSVRRINREVVGSFLLICTQVKCFPAENLWCASRSDQRCRILVLHAWNSLVCLFTHIYSVSRCLPLLREKFWRLRTLNPSPRGVRWKRQQQQSGGEIKHERLQIALWTR